MCTLMLHEFYQTGTLDYVIFFAASRYIFQGDLCKVLGNGVAIR